MEIDARPYRAGYNPAFLKQKGFSSQSGPHKLNGDDRAAIAKAYFAGMGPKELADQYGITLPHVTQIARRYDEERYLARRIIREARAVIDAPSMDTPVPAPIPEPVPAIIDRSGEFYVVHRDGMAINLPMLSILRG